MWEHAYERFPNRPANFYGALHFLFLRHAFANNAGRFVVSGCPGNLGASCSLFAAHTIGPNLDSKGASAARMVSALPVPPAQRIPVAYSVFSASL